MFYVIADEHWCIPMPSPTTWNRTTLTRLVKNNSEVIFKYLQNIFEDNQQDLEASTELLSEYLELDLNQEQDLSAMKRRVQDKTRYVEARRKKMIQVDNYNNSLNLN